MSYRIVVVSAGLNIPSSTGILADQITASVESKMRRADESVEFTQIELRELGKDIMSAMLSGGMKSSALLTAERALAVADAVVAVTPVFSASYSGLFKSFFDVLEMGTLRGKPVLLGATAGTARHSLVVDTAMRPLFAYLGALTLPTAIMAASADFGSAEAGEAHVDSLADRIERAATELVTQLRPGTGHRNVAVNEAGDSQSLAEFADFEGSMSSFAGMLGR
ncbi:NAD(P)H-dependent oxidoreductase [Ornithinimicrobium sp. Arc0846-15]|nr:NAD(P)H-dependent oxidoreductase [Ornithinimicrobium laminariae]